jgi:hypothetical protein
MDEIEGRPGELLDHLIELLNNDALGEGEWYSVSFYVTHFLGGRTLGSVMPDTGPPVPGSVAEQRRQRHEVVSRETYFELIRERLGELVANGLEEAFLARSVRDAVRQMLESLADVGTGDRNREEIRTQIEHDAEDPAAIAAFRTKLAEMDPSAETLSDEEVAARLRNMARLPVLQPTSPDEAAQKWALLTRWDQQAASLLPDAVFGEWRHRRPIA